MWKAFARAQTGKLMFHRYSGDNCNHVVADRYWIKDYEEGSVIQVIQFDSVITDRSASISQQTLLCQSPQSLVIQSRDSRELESHNLIDNRHRQ